MPVTIIPAILPKDLGEFENKFDKVKTLVDRVQLDVVDGVFAPAVTMEPQDLVGFTFGGVKLDVQLMVDEPIEWLEQCKAIGAERVIGHVERMEDLILFVAEAQVKGFGVGLGLDIETPVEKIAQVIEDLDVVLLMSDKAGQSGAEPFNEKVLPKIEEVRKLSKEITICVDGGLNVENIKKCLAAEWAEEIKEDELHRDFLNMEFAVGRELWNAVDVAAELEKLKHLRG